MDKILVEVFVPAINLSVDIFIPLQSPMHEVLELIKKAIVEISDERFIANDNTILAFREDGTIIDINLLVYELNIRNGSKLMLI